MERWGIRFSTEEQCWDYCNGMSSIWQAIHNRVDDEAGREIICNRNYPERYQAMNFAFGLDLSGLIDKSVLKGDLHLIEGMTDDDANEYLTDRLLYHVSRSLSPWPIYQSDEDGAQMRSDVSWARGCEPHVVTEIEPETVRTRIMTAVIRHILPITGGEWVEIVGDSAHSETCLGHWDATPGAPPPPLVY